MGSEERIVENIRSIAEILVYGDQHTDQLFDYFCEKNILSLFIAILEETHCSNGIKIQIIQTVSIIAQNIRSEISLYYILSNNHVNQLITHPFNFADEEVVAFYISFLKTLSLKLNPQTIQLFFNDRLNSLPLYEEAIKFFDHPEGMVRTAVRTITLNVYRIDDPVMRTFVTQGPPSRYFEDVIRNIHHSCRVLYLRNIRFEQLATDTEGVLGLGLGAEATQNVRATLLKLEVGMTELQDHFVYIEDILALKFADIEDAMIDAVNAYLFWPLVISSLLETTQPYNELEDMSAEELDSLGIDPESLKKASKSSPGALLSLFLLAQALFAISNPRLVNQLVETLFRPNLRQKVVNVESKDIFETKALEEDKSEVEVPEFLQHHSNGSGSKDGLNGNRSNPVCAAFYSYLASSDQRLVLGAICVLYAVTDNSAVKKDLLDMCNLSSAAQRRANKLLKRLTSPTASSSEQQRSQDPSTTLEDTRFPAALTSTSKSVKLDPKEAGQEPLGGKNISLAEEISSGVRVESQTKRTGSSKVEEQKQGSEVIYDYPEEIVSILLGILERSSPVRPLTQRAIAKLLVKLALDSKGPTPVLKPKHLKQLQNAYTMSVKRALAYMEVLSAETFLHLFQLTWKSVQAGPLRVEQMLNQPSHLLPLRRMKSKKSIAWNELQELVSLEARDPVGPLEDASQAINSCIVLRLLRSSMLKEPSSKLSGLCKEQAEVKQNKKINIESCEYVKVRVLGATKHGGRTMNEAYMVLAHDSLILVDPDLGRKGRGVTKSVAPLQYVNIGVDHLDPRQIHLCVHSQVPIGWARREKDLPKSVTNMLKTESSKPTVVDDIKIRRWFITLMFYDHATSNWAREDLQRAIDVTRKRKLRAIRQVLSEGTRR